MNHNDNEFGFDPIFNFMYGLDTNDSVKKIRDTCGFNFTCSLHPYSFCTNVEDFVIRYAKFPPSSKTQIIDSINIAISSKKGTLEFYFLSDPLVHNDMYDVILGLYAFTLNGEYNVGFELLDIFPSIEKDVVLWILKENKFDMIPTLCDMYLKNDKRDILLECISETDSVEGKMYIINYINKSQPVRVVDSFRL